MFDVFDVTEADEAATSKERALANLRDQVEKQESQGVVAMYERAAWNAGASLEETEAVFRSAPRTGRGGIGTEPCGTCTPCRQASPFDCWSPKKVR